MVNVYLIPKQFSNTKYPEDNIDADLVGYGKECYGEFVKLEDYKQVKVIVEKFIVVEKQIEDFADNGMSYARFRSWDIYGELVQELWKYAPELRGRPKQEICECGHKQWDEHKCTFDPMVAQECNVKGCKCKKFKLRKLEVNTE